MKKKVSIPAEPDDIFLDAWLRYLKGGVKGSVDAQQLDHVRRSYKFLVEYYDAVQKPKRP